MTIFEEYGNVDAQIKMLTEKKEVMRATILAGMIDEGKLKEDTPIGKFTIVKKKSWTLPDYIKERMEDLEGDIEKSKSTGEAKFIEKESLLFTPIKL